MKPVFKLAMVSIRHRGKLTTAFVIARYINGKAYVSPSLYQDMAKKAGVPAGHCFSTN